MSAAQEPQAAVIRSLWDGRPMPARDFSSLVDADGYYWDEYDAGTPIHDQLVLDNLAATVARPPLWRRVAGRIGDWIATDTPLYVLLILALAAIVALPVMAR